LRNGEHIRFPEVFFNAHESIPDLPDIPVVVRTTGFPLHGSKGNPEEYVLMHENVTAHRKIQEKSEKHLFEMQILSQSVMEYLNLPPDADLYGFFAKKLSVLLPGYRIILTEFSEAENLATVMAAEVGDDILATVIKILGRNLIGMRSPISPDARLDLMGKGIVTGPKGVYDLAGDAIPKPVCMMLDKLLNFGTIYGMGISTENTLYGNVILISPKGTELENRPMIESFIRQTSVAIQKRLAEDRIKTLLHEKTTLLLEVQHRIKNNIASIEGLLSLQLNSIGNPEAESALRDAIGRVGSIRILYEKLLLNDDYRETSVKGYLESLIDSILGLYTGKSGIACERSIEDFNLPLRDLSALGIVVNEILTNTMKHAFIGRGSGRIAISLTRANRRVKLTIQDNGRGLPEDFDFQKSKGFGLMLIGLLGEQLNGTFNMHGRAGTRSTLEFDA
jgi:two-component sensor histidine kinase